MKRTMLTLFASIVVSAVLGPLAAAKQQPTNDEAIAAITQFENDAVKANLAGDASFVEKNYATIGPAVLVVESGPLRSLYWPMQKTPPTIK